MLIEQVMQRFSIEDDGHDLVARWVRTVLVLAVFPEGVRDGSRRHLQRIVAFDDHATAFLDEFMFTENMHLSKACNQKTQVGLLAGSNSPIHHGRQRPHRTFLDRPEKRTLTGLGHLVAEPCG